MDMYEKICDFHYLYKAHKAARRGKRDTKEVIEFELDLAGNLTRLSDALRDGSYRMSGYYSFFVYDPKLREIHALSGSSEVEGKGDDPAVVLYKFKFVHALHLVPPL